MRTNQPASITSHRLDCGDPRYEFSYMDRHTLPHHQPHTCGGWHSVSRMHLREVFTFWPGLSSSRRRQKVAQVARFFILKKMDMADRRLRACTRHTTDSTKHNPSPSANLMLHRRRMLRGRTLSGHLRVLMHHHVSMHRGLYCVMCKQLISE